MKKIIVLLLMLMVAGSMSVFALSERALKRAAKKSAQRQVYLDKQAEKARIQAEKDMVRIKKEAAKQAKAKKDVLKDEEYKIIKQDFFNAEGYGDTYNCKVAQQRFCKVKDLDTGVYVLCDREVSRTQMESAKIFYKLGKCTKLN